MHQCYCSEEGVHHHRAYRDAQGQEAVEQYTSALQSRQAPSIAFAAVLHSNRAAARQLLGQHAEAIADCLRATALNPEYAKASCRCLMRNAPLNCGRTADLPAIVMTGYWPLAAPKGKPQYLLSPEGVQSC